MRPLAPGGEEACGTDSNSRGSFFRPQPGCRGYSNVTLSVSCFPLRSTVTSKVSPFFRSPIKTM